MAGADSCLGEASGTTTVQVRAFAIGSGRVTRAEVTASTLPLEARRCIRRYAERVRLVPPVTDPPRGITATLEWVRQAPPTPATPVQEPGPLTPYLPAAALPPGYRRNSTVPRSEGAVVPGHTLPPSVTTGRPAGFVAPGLTLPARVSDEAQAP